MLSRLLLMPFQAAQFISFTEKAQLAPADNVNPFIGKGGHGHTCPGAMNGTGAAVTRPGYLPNEISKGY